MFNSMNYDEAIQFLMEIGYTADELDSMWNSLVGIHPLITNLSSHGQTWRNLNKAAIRTLPAQCEKYKNEINGAKNV